jgi:8-oxo-dGTP pyrophosphatase MutT (NUDIX family)
VLLSCQVVSRANTKERTRHAENLASQRSAPGRDAARGNAQGQLMSETEAAVAIVHARGNAESVLLMRRSEREGDSWSGHWSFPGGRRDPVDRDLLHTALRELREECGVRLTRRDLDSEMPPRHARRKSGAAVRVTPFLFRVEAELPAVPDGREAVEASWIPLTVLRDPSHHLLLPVPGHPPEVLFPGVALNRAPLWGFTYRLICDWLGLGPQPGAGACVT